MIIDHICFAVEDLQKGIENWKNAFGYRQMTEIVTNTRQKVKVVFLTKEDSITIKLIEPLKRINLYLILCKEEVDFIICASNAKFNEQMDD